MSEIRLFWCDDEYEKKITSQSVYMDFLEDSDVKVKFFRNSDELLLALSSPFTLQEVDAVIFDYNMSNESITPDVIGVEKSGFLDILREIDRYARKGIPFYLWSKMDADRIEKDLNTSDNRRFFKIFKNYLYNPENPRFFPGTETFKETVKAVIDEVNRLNTPSRQLRLKYPEAFKAAKGISERCWDNIVTLLTLNSDAENWNKMEDQVNILRCDVEQLMTELGIPERDEITEDGVYFSALGRLISGIHEKYEIRKDLEDKELGYMISILTKLLNDGSHNKQNLDYHVRQYLIKKKDPQLLYFLTNLLIQLLIWAHKAKRMMVEKGEPVCKKKSISVKMDPSDKNLNTTQQKENKGGIEKQAEKIGSNKQTTHAGILEQDHNGYLHIGEDCQVTNLQVGKKYRFTPMVNKSGESGYRKFISAGGLVEDNE